MAIDKLGAALKAVDWSKNVSTFMSDKDAAAAVASANLRVAIWAKQFENIDKGNPALCFVRETQIAGQHVAALLALSLYKPAAASMRAMLETALCYSYFRTHSAELETLVRDPSFYLEKSDYLEFHKIHTPRFVEMSQALGVTSKMKDWYSKTSAVIHGQIPGTWIEHKSLAETATLKKTQDAAVATFCEGEEILHRFFLCSVGRLLWDSFSPSAKQQLVSGLSGPMKAALAIDVS
jgi:hypothetical protein